MSERPVDATLRDGVLTVVLPKARTGGRRAIRVLHLAAQTDFGPLPCGRLHALEFDDAEFAGELTLPDRGEKKNISATLAGGVLTIKLPFIRREGPRRIPVTPGEPG